MRRSIFATIMFFVSGLFLISAAIPAQAQQAAVTASTIEQQHACNGDSRVKHSFIVRLKDEVSSILSRMKAIIMEKGGIFEGNKEYGSFEGKTVLGTIKGEYRCISDNEIEITIKDKPLFLAYSTIVTEIKKYLII